MKKRSNFSILIGSLTKIVVSNKYRCGEDAIISYLTNDRSDICHYCVSDKRGIGSQISTFHTLILGLFVSQFGVPIGGGIIRQADLINH